MNSVALRETSEYREMERDYWDRVAKDRRDTIRAKIGDNPRAKAVFEAVCKFVDQKRERKYSKRLDPKGHFQALSYDSSNRMTYCDQDTGWRERRS
jgi:hypothetical protein